MLKNKFKSCIKVVLFVLCIFYDVHKSSIKVVMFVLCVFYDVYKRCYVLIMAEWYYYKSLHCCPYDMNMSI